MKSPEGGQSGKLACVEYLSLTPVERCLGNQKRPDVES